MYNEKNLVLILFMSDFNMLNCHFDCKGIIDSGKDSVVYTPRFVNKICIL